MIFSQNDQSRTSQGVTSIADLLSSLWKIKLSGGFVTIMAVVGTTPYIALQLQSVTLSLLFFKL